MKKLEFMHFEDCPSYEKTLSNLREVLTELEVNLDLELVNVESCEKAKQLGFYGSPTIKVDGADLEGRTGDCSYNCRLYNVDGNLTGVLTKDFIREKLYGLIFQN